MMLAGYLAVGLAFKARFREVPLLLLLLAVQLLEWIWIILVLTGTEQARLVPTSTVTAHLEYLNPFYSHSLFWSAFYAVVVYLLFVGAQGQSHWALPLGLGVFCHWPLDWLMQSGTLHLANFSPLRTHGLGLQVRYPAAAMAVEVGLVISCWYAYYRTLRNTFPDRMLPAWAMLVVLLLLALYPLLLHALLAAG